LAILAGVDVRAGTLEEPDVRFVPPREEAVEAAPVIVDARATAETAHREVDAVRSERRSQLKLTADGGGPGVRPGPTLRDAGGGRVLRGFSRRARWRGQRAAAGSARRAQRVRGRAAERAALAAGVPDGGRRRGPGPRRGA